MNEAAPAPEFEDIGDLSALSYADEIEYRVLHPVTGKETNWVWRIAGPGHEKTLASQEASARRERELQSKYQQSVIAATKANKPIPDRHDPTPSETRERNAEVLAARVLGFTPVPIDGQVVEYSHETAKRLLGDPAKGWLLTQIAGATFNNEGFLPNSAQIS